MLNADTVHSIIQTLGRGIWSSTTTPAGVLVTLSGNDTTDVINALRAAGYTATEVGSGTVMVGGVDRIALLDAHARPAAGGDRPGTAHPGPAP